MCSIPFKFICIVCGVFVWLVGAWVWGLLLHPGRSWYPGTWLLAPFLGVVARSGGKPLQRGRGSVPGVGWPLASWGPRGSGLGSYRIGHPLTGLATCCPWFSGAHALFLPPSLFSTFHVENTRTKHTHTTYAHLAYTDEHACTFTCMQLSI